METGNQPVLIHAIRRNASIKRLLKLPWTGQNNNNNNNGRFRIVYSYPMQSRTLISLSYQFRSNKLLLKKSLFQII